MCISELFFILEYKRGYSHKWGETMQFKIEKTEHVNRTFRITKELADTLSEIAQREGISVNELVVQCCNYAISNMEETNDKKN